jgi:hypothetical protein
MKPILIIQEIDHLKELKNRTLVVEIDAVEKIEPMFRAVTVDNHLLCINVHINQDITAISFQKEWRSIPLVFFLSGLGSIRELIFQYPILKKLNIKFFFESKKKQNYEAVQTLSSLGIGSGIIISEDADWNKLCDLMYFALCSKHPHAPIEPFQFLYDLYDKNSFLDYGIVFFNNRSLFKNMNLKRKFEKSWNQFDYTTETCSSCAGWRICLGKFAGMKDKTGCSDFTVKLLNLIESMKFK